MATQSGSLSERLSKVCVSHLHKIHWDNDLQLLPENDSNNFLLLKKLISDNVHDTVQKKRRQFQQENGPGAALSEDDLRLMINTKTVIRDFHWTKAKKAAQLISDLYFSIGLAMKEV